MATFQEVIDEARLELNDRDKVRYPDANLFVHVKSGVREIAMFRPDLFETIGDLACQATFVKQSVVDCDPPGIYVIDVHNVNGGRAVTKGDFDTLRRARPGWRQDPVGECQNWFPVTDDMTKRPQPEFYHYPPAPAGQVLRVQYVKEPLDGTETVDSDIPLPDSMSPLLRDYAVFRAESVDDEHVLTQRAAQAYQRYLQGLGVSEAKRKQVIMEGRPQ